MSHTISVINRCHFLVEVARVIFYTHQTGGVRAAVCWHVHVRFHASNGEDLVPTIFN